MVTSISSLFPPGTVAYLFSRFPFSSTGATQLAPINNDDGMIRFPSMLPRVRKIHTLGRSTKNQGGDEAQPPPPPVLSPPLISFFRHDSRVTRTTPPSYS